MIYSVEYERNSRIYLSGGARFDETRVGWRIEVICSQENAVKRTVTSHCSPRQLIHRRTCFDKRSALSNIVCKYVNYLAFK